MTNKLGVRIMIGIPTTKMARRSMQWMLGLQALEKPLGCASALFHVEDKPIAQARNEICEAALQMNADYVFMISDDVIAPPTAILAMLDKIGRTFPDQQGQPVTADMITGVYWTKSANPEPYLWRGVLNGPFVDWKVGEFCQIDWAGCDCLLIDTRVLKGMTYPWFSTDWVWEPGQRSSSILTEDAYFYAKARAAGFRLFADTGIQCVHEDRTTGVMHGLTMEMPQAGGLPECGNDDVLVADIGAGHVSPYFGPNAKVVRFDAREDTKPDIRCDILHLPEHYHGTFDVVHARHVLEHFSRAETVPALTEWARLAKDGGKLIIRVPNVQQSFRDILSADPNLPEEWRAVLGPPPPQQIVERAWDEVYGGQKYALDFHKAGFTPRKLDWALRAVEGLTGITVETEDNGTNLKGTATVRKVEPEALTTFYEQIVAQEGPGAFGMGQHEENGTDGNQHRGEADPSAADTDNSGPQRADARVGV